MSLSVFDIFKIGIGPSSSHTMGPMLAAHRFVTELERLGLLSKCSGVGVQLFGSLALTGRGHCSDRALILGLSGYLPDRIDPDQIDPTLEAVRDSGRLRLLGQHEISFDQALDILFEVDQFLPRHPNGMRFSARGEGDEDLLRNEYFSIGGGFVVQGDEPLDAGPGPGQKDVELPYPFKSGDELLATSRKYEISIDQLLLANEGAWRPENETRARLQKIWQVMRDCVLRGFANEGVLPGGLNVTRRAPAMHRDLKTADVRNVGIVMDWVDAWALAVNEENAAGARVVTAPTNGAAGIIPAVLHYYVEFFNGADERGVERFLLVAGGIGMLYKMNASISGAEMGCQGEVGVACSMAAAGLVAAGGGHDEQIENAAEIGMEHNLGLTCDPIRGLVQIPCIERNAMGAVKAINAARIALRGDGSHKVSLDQVIETMRQTGEDMRAIYKETSRGGLAVNVTEC